VRAAEVDTRRGSLTRPQLSGHPLDGGRIPVQTVNRIEPTRFLAMEYYLLMWNRSFEVTITSSLVCGAFVRGAIAATFPSVVAARVSNDATRLVNAKRLARSRAEEPGSPGYLALHRFNFAIPQSMIASIRFDPKPKWGMGPVPHSGRLHLDLRDRKSRELILLGSQDGAAHLRAIRQLGYPAAV